MDSELSPWQFKWRGLWWKVLFYPLSEFPGELRPAWWFLWPKFKRGPSGGKYNIGCYRVCGITLHGRVTPWTRFVF